MDYSSVFGAGAPRLHGIPPAALIKLGRQNLNQLIELARKNLLLSEHDRDERAEIRAAISTLEALSEAAPSRPILPALRSGVPMKVGDAVHVYLGDTPGQRTGWVPATVVEVVKDYKRIWSHHAARGYYWRIVARLPDGSLLPFSSSEPRVIPRAAFALLTEGSDPEFTALYAANAHKSWQPIWCIERNLTVDTDAMDMAAWLADA